MKIGIWLKTECKRMRACLPGLALKVIILTLLVSETAFGVYRMWSHNETPVVKIGYSAPQDELTGLALTYIKHMDALRGWCSLVEVSSEEEGLEALEQQQLSALIVLPDKVVEGIINGTNEPARLYLSGHSQALGYVFEELANAGIGMLSVAQAEIYATDDLLSAAGADRQTIEQQFGQIDIHNLNLVMNRGTLWEEDSISATGAYGAVVYYTSAFLTCLMLVAGLFMGKYCRRSKAEERITRCRLSVPYYMQAIGRNGVTAIPVACLLLLPGIIMGLASWRGLLPSIELTLRNVVLLILLLLCSGAYAQLLYGLSGRSSTTLLLTSIAALIQGYISGCFLPSAILPQIVEKLSHFIPATYIKEGFTIILTGKRQQFAQTCIGLICWMVLFTAVEVILLCSEEKEPGIRVVRTWMPGSYMSAILFRRLLHQKSFWLCLIITSVLSCVMIRAERESDTVLRAAYYTENEELRTMLASYEGLVEFCAEDSEEAVRKQVLTGKAECGYVIDSDVVQQFQDENTYGEIEVWEAEDAVLTGVVNEVLFQQIYTLTSGEWYCAYMDRLQIDGAQAGQALERRMHDGSTFTFERQVVQPTQQQSGQTSYPVWIIVVIQVVLCGLLGVLRTYQDYGRHYCYKRSYAGILVISMVQPMLLAALAGVLTIVFYNSY